MIEHFHLRKKHLLQGFLFCPQVDFGSTYKSQKQKCDGILASSKGCTEHKFLFHPRFHLFSLFQPRCAQVDSRKSIFQVHGVLVGIFLYWNALPTAFVIWDRVIVMPIYRFFVYRYIVHPWKILTHFSYFALTR